MTYWEESFKGHVQRPDFVGLTVAQAEELALSSGYSRVRVIDQEAIGTRITMDLSSTRLNLLVSDGRVILAAVF